MTHPQDLSLRHQASHLATGELDPRELLAATLARIDERDGALNSIAASFADESARMLAQAPPGPLYGVPVAIKDMFQLPWRGPRDGSAEEHLPAGESALYRRLRDAGAVIVAVTNMHLYGAGTTGEVSAYGPVANPWDPERCGGGSSGGSAAAVGARLVGGAVGTDGGGSVRLPAAYCGITGLKPTFAATPVEGYTHAYTTMGVAGPMCRDAADTRLLAETLIDRPLPKGDGSRLRAGVVSSPFWDDLDPDVERSCRATLEASGWPVEDVTLPGAEHALIASVLRLTMESLPAIRLDQLQELDPLTRALIKYELVIPARSLMRADRVRTLLRRSAEAAFDSVDLLVWPTVPAPAPRIDNPTIELPSGLLPADVGNVRQAGFGNLCGLPGISTPVGQHPSGVPIGLQLHARWGGEALLLDAAEQIERATGRRHVDAVPVIAR